VSDGYLSRDKAHLAKLQRARRARLARIDYMPSDEALALIDAKRSQRYPLNTNSGVLDAIVLEWAELAGIQPSGIKNPEISKPKTLLPGASQDALLQRLYGVRQKKTLQRVICGAKRHRDGNPCQALSVPGKKRCRFHGGMSTGPRTAEGKARVTQNLRSKRRSKETSP